MRAVTSTDTFRRFVDVLADTLDDPGAYVGRLHLSPRSRSSAWIRTSSAGETR
jgi:hypothetical protein